MSIYFIQITTRLCKELKMEKKKKTDFELQGAYYFFFLSFFLSFFFFYCVHGMGQNR